VEGFGYGFVEGWAVEEGVGEMLVLSGGCGGNVS
jgi:hypothetical protein